MFASKYKNKIISNYDSMDFANNIKVFAPFLDFLPVSSNLTGGSRFNSSILIRFLQIFHRFRDVLFLVEERGPSGPPGSNLLPGSRDRGSACSHVSEITAT